MRKWKFGAVVSWVIWASMTAGGAHADSYAEDRSQVENLIARYLFALDWRDADAYAATFAEDGILDFAGGQLKGRKAIHDMIAGLLAREKAAAAKDTSGRRPIRKRHFVTNIVLDVTGNTAKGRAYWTQVSNATPDGKPMVAEYGHYEDELVKVNGKWLFSKRVVFNEMLPSRAAKDMP